MFMQVISRAKFSVAPGGEIEPAILRVVKSLKYWWCWMSIDRVLNGSYKDYL